MFEIIKKMFIVSLTNIVRASNYTKCILLSNQKWEIKPTLVKLHRNEYRQKLHYYLFAVKLDKCVGSCNTLKDTLKTFNDFKNKQKKCMK